jgi:2-amino-4-hydroxy-6-hydroxymethyldihydropteridine diphosphokinase
MNKAYLSLGSNEGDRLQWLKRAMELITANCGSIVARSSVYEAAAWGITEQPDFLNMAICVQTSKTPLELLLSIHEIEATLGRQRDVKWGQRTLDIDILLFNHEIIDMPELQVPHPYLHERRFTLLPLDEIAEDYMHPVLNKRIAELLEECPDKLEVKQFDSLFP